MRQLFFLGLLSLMAFKPVNHEENPVRTNHLVGINALSLADKQTLDAMFTTALQDKDFAAKVEKIKKENKLSGGICFGMWDDRETWCLRKSAKQKPSLCSAAPFTLKEISYFQRYCFLYDCDNYTIYMVWLC